jgi:DNA processing protein
MRPEDELAAWLRLALVPGLGSQGQRKLLKAFGLPPAIFSASQAALGTIVGATLAENVLSRRSESSVAAALQWAAESGHRLLTLADADYPALLLEIADPPVFLYARGNTDLLQRSGIAIVGSRNATAQGRANAEQFAHALSDAGLTVISGLALGIDAAAHVGALQGRGSTIALLGTGIDLVYPARNRELHERIANEGLLLSEFPLGTPATSYNFPRRNRLISGLARGVVVVEAALASGSLITARQAGEQGRDIFAIPGSIHSPLSRGCHALLKQGAKLVESAQDILEELGAHSPVRSSATLPDPSESAPESVLLRHLGYDPCSVDALCERSGLTPESVSAMLLQLELEGRVERLPGSRYQRLHD